MSEEKPTRNRKIIPAKEFVVKETSFSESEPEDQHTPSGAKNQLPVTERMAKSVFPAVVAKVVDPITVVINRGSDHGVKLGQRFLLYRLSGEEILDPVTNEPLGELEIRKGIGRVTQIQERISTLQSDDHEPMKPATIGAAAELVITGGASLKWRTVPFLEPAIGDLAKPVS
jgi:hypothetical protein